MRSAVLPLTILQNLLSHSPTFRNDRLQIAGDSNIPGEVIGHFLKLPNPPSQPAPPDADLSFPSQPVTAPAPGPRAWVRTAMLTPDAPLTLLTAGGKELRVGSLSLPFPGGPHGVAPTPDGIAVFDDDNDRALDLACAGAGGLRLYHQTADHRFLDVTGKSKLPATDVNGSWGRRPGRQTLTWMVNSTWF